MAIDGKLDLTVSPPAALPEKIRTDDLDRTIDRPSDIERKTAVKRPKAVETPTDPFEGFGSFS